MTDSTYRASLRRKPLPSIAEIRRHFRYDPETGTVTTPTGKTGSFVEGTGLIVAYCVNRRRVRIPAHRVAWAITHGRWPHMIRHRNHDKADNRLSNLAEYLPR